MDWKAALQLVLDPRLLAAAGGFAGYRFVGRGKPGAQPYLYAGGGVVAGYLVGTIAQKMLAPPQVVVQQVAAPQQQALKGYQVEDMLDLDPTPTTKRPALLPPAAPDYAMAMQQAAAPEAPVLPGSPEEHKPDARADGASDWNLLNSLGSYADQGGDGLGSYEDHGLDDAIEETLAENRQKQRLLQQRRGPRN